MISFKCETCDTEPMSFSWTDTHGIGQCTNCGTPYRIYHYDEHNKPIKKEPQSIVGDLYKPLLRKYWEETHSIIHSGCSFDGGQELASWEQAAKFYAWIKQNDPELQEAP